MAKFKSFRDLYLYEPPRFWNKKYNLDYFKR